MIADATGWTVFIPFFYGVKYVGYFDDFVGIDVIIDPNISVSIIKQGKWKKIQY